MNAVPEFDAPLDWPEKLDDAGRACFFRVQARLRLAGVWDLAQLGNVMLTCSTVSMYVEMHGDVSAARDRFPARNFAELERDLERVRMIARRAIARYGLLTADRISLRALTGELDQEIADLCSTLH